MARGFPAGVPGLLQALAWIQREAATGSLGLAGAETGRSIAFRQGLVHRISVGDAEPGEGAVRDQARSLMEDWGFSESLLLFTDAAEEGGVPSDGAGRLNAADLILDLIRTGADPRWVRRRIGDLKGAVRSPAALPKILPNVAVSPTDAFLLSRADGTLSLEEILRISPMEATDVELSLYGLAMVGLLEAAGVQLPGEELPEPGVEPGPAAQPRFAEGQSAPPSAAPEPPPVAARGAQLPEEATPLHDGAGRAGATPSSKPPGRVTSALDDFLARTAARSPAPSPQVPAAPPVASRPAGAGGATAAGGAAGGAAASPAPAGSYARSPELEKLRQEVLDWIANSAGTDHYGVLGVDRSAGEKEIRRAYYALAKRFHPDKFRTPEFEGLLQDVEKMFASTTEAYNTLTDDRARAEYEADSSKGSAGKRGGEADLPAQARESFLRARRHVDGEEYYDAAALLETACRLDGSKPEYWLLLGKVQERNPRWRRKAEASFQKVIEMDPTSADGYLQLARLYRAGGLQTRALEMFKKVVEWDPQNEEALAGISGKGAGQTSGVGSRIRSIFKGSRS
jgi:tetratricopeptide (TPR) repeat protein